MLMKTMKFIWVCLLLLCPLLVQAQHNLFSKYGDVKGVSSVYISKTMMEMNPNFLTGDVYIGKVAKRLNSVQILSTKDRDLQASMLKDIRSLLRSSKYELLMKQKGSSATSEVYVNRKGDKIKEFIMMMHGTVMHGAVSLKFVYMEGEMTPDDIKMLMLYQKPRMDTSCNLSRMLDGACDLADAEMWEGLQGLEELEALKSLEGLKGLENLKELESLKDLGRLKDSGSLKKEMDSETWKQFEESMRQLERDLKSLE